MCKLTPSQARLTGALVMTIISLHRVRSDDWRPDWDHLTPPLIGQSRAVLASDWSWEGDMSIVDPTSVWCLFSDNVCHDLLSSLSHKPCYSS